MIGRSLAVIGVWAGALGLLYAAHKFSSIAFSDISYGVIFFTLICVSTLIMEDSRR